MNFSSMDYFIMVAKERSFTKAAQRLHITQQTLSAHIAGLEQEIGSSLLIRHVPLELTYAGQVFLRYASDFQRKRHAMKQELSDIANNQKGLLRIGIAATRGRAIMPTLIDAFQTRYPQIGIRLAEGSNDMLRQRLTDGEIDLAIANFPEAIPGVELNNFYQEEVVLLIAQKLLLRLYGDTRTSAIQRVNKGELSMLRDCPFLLNSPLDIAGRIGRSLLAEAGIISEPNVEAFNVETLLDLCVRGAGACFCPENLMKASLSKAQISGLQIFRFGADARYMIRFGCLKQAYRWHVISNFIALAQQLVPGVPATDRAQT